MNRFSIFFTSGLFILLAACTTPGPADSCPANSQDLADCPPPEAIEDPLISALYLRRTWVSADEHQVDVVDIGVALDIPQQNARTKFLGARSEDALNSLAAKIWMIENARHTIDATYYIFKRDLIGEAMLGALCNAVKRGVDIRFMVDSVGSIDSTHSGLKALETCADDAGYMRNADGKLTNKRARIQVVVFNAVSNVFVKLNRRSHDKLLVVDGRFPEHAMVMTGGRNVSLSYYGITADGSPNPDTYMDAEILLRTSADLDADPYPLGALAENYYTILFLFDDNKRLSPSRTAEALGIYDSKQQMAQDALAKLKALPSVKPRLDAMPTYLEQGWHESKIMLAHELDNLTNKKLFSGVVENLDNNDNSIQYLLRQIPGRQYKQRRIVSPYLFAAQYYDEDGNLALDGARNVHDWLEQHPEASLEIITNSILTSDNFSAQAVIDMNMAPRLLLTPELQEAWLESRDDSEMSPDLVESEEWIKLVNHPRLKIYETGRLDDRLLGGDVDYGKLHAKYIVMDDAGFVGTTNFDDRSGLINNEMGFFFADEEMAKDLHADFELLKSRSYLWGSPEWLEFRRRVFELDGLKGNTSKSQRAIYKTLRAVGLDHQL
ncbi:MAG: phospholipase D-like domain-containing protein [Gammaproteobacteria bacterium]|jgi:phosphatidylserine/phosphatidylglycerophosphate/cardiolipin synthase-like enzyme|nr:phospholipase D-like domain-containing protein [Gammaproteobacteria bacterium]